MITWPARGDAAEVATVDALAASLPGAPTVCWSIWPRRADASLRRPDWVL